MSRHLLLIIYLPFCVLLSPSQPTYPSTFSESDSDQPFPSELLSLLAPATQAGFPGNQPWAGIGTLGLSEDTRPLPDNAAMERLACEDPIAFLEHCIRRYQRSVSGYTSLLEKHERIDGKMLDLERIEISFRERPFGVCMRWLEGAMRVDRALYVRGENDGNMRVRTRYVGLLVSRDPEGRDARQAGRYTLKEFGLKKGSERVLDSWREAARRGDLYVEFAGEQVVPRAGGRTCWVLHRSRYPVPEEDGITDLVIYIDKETWLQVGSVLRGGDGQLIAEYFFRDLRLNPPFSPEQFTDAALR